MPKARVFVTLKPSVFDPQGKTIHEALRSLGYASVADVRQGKFFEVELSGVSADEARGVVDEIARRVLSNPVIESYRVEVDGADPGRGGGAGPSGVDEVRGGRGGGEQRVVGKSGPEAS